MRRRDTLVDLPGRTRADAFTKGYSVLQQLTGFGLLLVLLQQRFFVDDPPDPIDGFQTSLLIKLEKFNWGSILDNKSDGHAR